MDVIESTGGVPREAGVYRNVPFSSYLAIDAVSNSDLARLAKSAAHYRHRSDESTPSMRFGSLCHCGRLEPLALAERYAVMPAYHLDAENATADGKATTSSATRYVKDKVAQFAAANRDREIVARESYQLMASLVESVSQHDIAGPLFAARGDVELTLVWFDAECGVRCKARIDKVSDGRLVDLKTTADLLAFPKSLARYGYHRQLAHYQAGYIALTGDTLEPWIVAVESSPPHCVAAAPLDEETLNCGAARRRNLLETLADCLASDSWPGPPSPSAWRVPEWELGGAEPLELTVNGKQLRF